MQWASFISRLWCHGTCRDECCPLVSQFFIHHNHLGSPFKQWGHLLHNWPLPSFHMITIKSIFMMQLWPYKSHNKGCRTFCWFGYLNYYVIVYLKWLPCYSFMGRGVIDLPMDEVASFIVLPETAFLYDKYNVVSWWLVSTHKNSSSNIVVISIGDYSSSKSWGDYIHQLWLHPIASRHVRFCGKFCSTMITAEADLEMRL